VVKSSTRVALFVVMGVVALAAIFVGSSLTTDQPQFCPSCHEMQPHYAAWGQGPHRDVSCIECHVDRGLPARFAHKFVALGEVYSHFTGNNKFPRAVPPDVPDDRCVPCHEDLPDTIGKFPHAAHAEKGKCAECHYDTGHSVTNQALKDAGVFAADVVPQRLVGKLASVGAGRANLSGHQQVSCSRCHDMAATPCSACHVPRGDKHPKVGKQPCTQCHATSGASWAFAHPNVTKECAQCHRAPGSHPAGACENCHKKSGTSWAFQHPGVGEEHSYRSFDCKKCHPVSYDKVYCTCHKGRPPRD